MQHPTEVTLTRSEKTSFTLSEDTMFLKLENSQSWCMKAAATKSDQACHGLLQHVSITHYWNFENNWVLTQILNWDPNQPGWWISKPLET